jgi:hypothetical protein
MAVRARVGSELGHIMWRDERRASGFATFPDAFHMSWRFMIFMKAPRHNHEIAAPES